MDQIAESFQHAHGLGPFVGFLGAFWKSAATRIEEIRRQLLCLVAR
jgi:hypothetical protein